MDYRALYKSLNLADHNVVALYLDILITHYSQWFDNKKYLSYADLLNALSFTFSKDSFTINGQLRYWFNDFKNSKADVKFQEKYGELNIDTNDIESFMVSFTKNCMKK